MTQFLFGDIFKKSAFQTFFQSGRKYDATFAYELSFGFQPRQFNDSASERYMLEEEGDATEIFFVLKGSWAIAFDCFTKLDEDNLDEIDPHMRGRHDMRERSILIA